MSETKQPMMEQEKEVTQPSPKKEVCRQLKSKESIDILDDTFDIVESEPDHVTTTDDDDDDDKPLTKNYDDNGEEIVTGPPEPSRRRLSQTARALLSAAEAETLQEKDAKRLAEEAAKNEEEILNTQVGFWDVMSCIDRQLLTLFGKTMIGFYLAVVVCVCIHVTITYFVNKDLWFKYFPADDDSNSELDFLERSFERQDL